MAQQSGNQKRKAPPSKKQTPKTQQEQKQEKKGIPMVLFILVLLLLLAAIGYVVYDMQWGAKSKMQVEIQAKDDKIEELSLRVDSLTEINDILAEHNPSMSGTFYEVQIGAFQEFNLDKYMEEFANLKGEVHNGMDKYTLAKFRSKAKAQRFRNDIKKMGIQDAFIVKKRDGERVDM